MELSEANDLAQSHTSQMVELQFHVGPPTPEPTPFHAPQPASTTHAPSSCSLRLQVS